MPKSKRLHYKDIDALRFMALVPVFLFCVLYISRTEREGFHYELTELMSFIMLNSMDFFFFISAFLITSHGLREYKYLESFSLRNFYVRRLFRLAPLMLTLLVFALLIYPWILRVLKLDAAEAPGVTPVLILFPNYSETLLQQPYLYYPVLATLYLFSQFYLIWGVVLKFFKSSLIKVSIAFVFIGIASRIIHHFHETSFVLDTFSYGVAIGIGGILAKWVRDEHPLIVRIKVLPKKIVLPIYLVGVLLVLACYVISDNFLISALVPMITCIFYAYLVVDQTYGKNSPAKLRNSKVITHLGKISLGIIVYHAMISVLMIIGIDTLEFEVSSPAIKLSFAVAAFVVSWVLADLSYNFFEKPLLRLRMEFKKA